MRIAGQWMLILVLVFTVGAYPVSAVQARSLPPAPQGAPAPIGAPAPALQGAVLATVSPAACPGSGCAAGQRMNMRYDFVPAGLRAATEPDRNLKICIYAPNSWAIDTASVTAAATGEITGKAYAAPASGETGCIGDDAKPDGYSLIMERVATLPQTAFADALGFGFRLGSTAAGSGRVLARLLTHDGTRWNVLSSQQATSTPTLTPIPTSSRVFVANDAASCNSGVPCYLNSGDDLIGGGGTGLKDAVDAVPDGATIYVMGSYNIKGSAVKVNKKVLLTGHNDSRISYGSSDVCTNAILQLTGEVVLRGLNISDGLCSNPSRNLIEIDSAAGIMIENNDLTGGKDAITIADNTGPVTVRFNSIANNTGYAVRAAGASSGAALLVFGNNLINQPVICNEASADVIANRKVNHNYWGGGAPSEADTRCKSDSNKRLGMAIALEPNDPGVRAQLVNVTENLTGAYDNQISYKRAGGADFPLIIVDHGYASAGGPPFSFARGAESPSPCSNYWDVFLPDGITATGSLELLFKYDRTTACVATIKSNQYCDQTNDMYKYPLYWYDLANDRWVTTGTDISSNSDPQVTTCEDNNQIRVVIDDEPGRPSLNNDLRFQPFMAGVPVIKSFVPLASTQSITVRWETNNEPDIVGFYVLRGPQGGQLSTISDLIAHTGTNLTGKVYSFPDPGRVNGVTYDYRLQVLRGDGTSIYSKIVSIMANPATITPIPSPTMTWTPRPTFTPYPTARFTLAPTRLPPTRTATRRPVTPAATSLILATRTATLDMSLPGAPFTATSIAQTRAVLPAFPTPTFLAGDLTETTGTPGTPVAMVSGTPGTPSPSVSPTPSVSITPTGSRTASAAVGGMNARSGAPSPWLSLLLGLLAGLAVTGGLGAAWYYLRLKQ